MQQSEFFTIGKLGRVVYVVSRQPDGWMLSRLGYRPGFSVSSDADSGPLRTSRGHIRWFRSLDTVATTCRAYGVKHFEVAL